MRTSMFIVSLLVMAACSPAQQTAVGGGVAAMGALVTAAAVAGMAGLCEEKSERDGTCDPSKPTSPSVGMPLAMGGIGLAVIGGVIMAKGLGHRDSPRAAAPAPPTPPEENPAPLAETDAVGMAAAHLVLVGIDGDKSRKLLGVDGAQSTLYVDGPHAELWNLRVHTADGPWLRVRACYEYDTEWKVTSVGTAPCAL